MQSLESPHNAFHVRKVKGLVVIFKVNPTRLSIDIAFPFVGVTQHTRAAIVVEFFNTEFGDFRMSRNT